MTNQHPITPPPELVEQWEAETACVAVKAARWGADQELDACCAEVSFYEGKNLQVKLRAARRPKPPTLKEQALEWLIAAEPILKLQGIDPSNTIRRALEALPND
jgi:hypothetical protein